MIMVQGGIWTRWPEDEQAPSAPGSIGGRWNLPCFGGRHRWVWWSRRGERPSAAQESCPDCRVEHLMRAMQEGRPA